MTTATVLAALQAKHRALAGIRQAPDRLPQLLNTADLPLIWTQPGPTLNTGGWRASGGAWYETHRNYLVTCYVKPIALGEGFNEGFQEAVVLLDVVGIAYMSDMNLSGAVAHLGGRDASGILDTGVTVVYFGPPGTEKGFHGFRFQVEVVEKLAI